MNQVRTFVNILMTAIRTGIREAVFRQLWFPGKEIIGCAFLGDVGEGALSTTVFAFQNPSRLGHVPIVDSSRNQQIHNRL